MIARGAAARRSIVAFVAGPSSVRSWSLLVAACVVVGIVIGDAVGAIGSGRRRAPDVPYWSVR